MFLIKLILGSNYDGQEYITRGHNHSALNTNYNPIYGLSQMPPTMTPLNPLVGATNSNIYGGAATPLSLLTPAASTTSNHYHHESCFCYDCQDQRNKYRLANSQSQPQMQQQQNHHYYGLHQNAISPNSSASNHHYSQYSPASNATSSTLQAAHIQNERMQKRVNELLSDRRKMSSGLGAPLGTNGEQHQMHYGNTSNGNYMGHQHYGIQQQSQHSPAVSSISQQMHNPSANWDSSGLYGMHSSSSASHMDSNSMTLNRSNGLDVSDDAEQFTLSEVTLERQALGFGFRIVGGTEEGSQVTVGHIVPGGAADNDHRITSGDEILSIDGINVVSLLSA